MLSKQFTQGMNTYPKTTEGIVCLLNNYKTTRANHVAASQHEEEEVASLKQGKQDKRRRKSGSGGKSRSKKAKQTKAKKVGKRKKLMATNSYHSCGKKGYLQVGHLENKQDHLSINSDSAGIDQLGFGKFEDCHSCESGDDIFNQEVQRQCLGPLNDRTRN